jgi:hypothetical protein
MIAQTYTSAVIGVVGQYRNWGADCTESVQSLRRAQVIGLPDKWNYKLRLRKFLPLRHRPAQASRPGLEFSSRQMRISSTIRAGWRH